MLAVSSPHDLISANEAHKPARCLFYGLLLALLTSRERDASDAGELNYPIGLLAAAPDNRSNMEPTDELRHCRPDRQYP
jgi:hypothetical protein